MAARHVIRLAIAVVIAVTAVVVAMAATTGDTSPPPPPPPPPTDPATPPVTPDPIPTPTPSATAAAVFRPPTPPAAAEHVDERAAMVDRQIAFALGRTQVRDESVLEAMRRTPRHAFVPESSRKHAYRDSPLPIGHGQTISQPYIVALMTELLDVTPESRVLEIGTGSAYQAAVLAYLTPNVYSIEIVEPLAKRAAATLRDQGYDTVETRHADGYHGWPEAGPFDAIIVTCAAGHLPPPLWEQLRPGGVIVIPIGGPYEVQRLVKMTKQPDGRRRSETITAVRFVPMTGRAQE